MTVFRSRSSQKAIPYPRRNPGTRYDCRLSCLLLSAFLLAQFLSDSAATLVVCLFVGRLIFLIARVLHSHWLEEKRANDRLRFRRTTYRQPAPALCAHAMSSAQINEAIFGQKQPAGIDAGANSISRRAQPAFRTYPKAA